MEQGSIYIATNKENGKRYVGQTCIPVCKRIEQHFKGNNSFLFGSALRKYGIAGFDVQQIVYGRDVLNEWEQYFIGKLNTIQPNGYNLTSGGCQNFKVSEATRLKLSNARKGSKNHMYGKPCSEERKAKIGAKTKERMTHPEYRKRISDALIGKRKGIKQTEEHRRKNSEAQKGKVINEKTRIAVGNASRNRIWTAEMRDRVSRRMKGNKFYLTRPPITDETRRKLSDATKGENNPRYGVRLSDETKRKIGIARIGKGHAVTEETKEKIRLALSGRHPSEQTKEKMKQAWVRRRAKLNELCSD